MTRDPKPTEPQFIKPFHSRYACRDFYGQNADESAELHWRRDLCAWYERRERASQAFANNINEALNSGDGSYRP